jgi:N-acetyl-gamma-glutamyl-phosphate/LysW-gamma-L-alpha-aminoadipyl-6-phosphate reductase
MRNKSLGQVKNMRVGVIGGSGYAGGELIRLLVHHPQAEITTVTSQRYAGEFLYMVHPNLRGHTQIKFSPMNLDDLAKKCDVVFLATPHGVSKDLAPDLLKRGLKIIDLSADFRLKNPKDYPKWYNWEHPHPEMLSKAVFGLPELHRNEMRGAPLIACVGCMSGASILGLAPMVKAGFIDLNHISIDAKIGSSGGGSEPTPASHHTERFGGVRPYQVVGHRHIAEIEQELSTIANTQVNVGFTPHALDIARGILITAQLWLTQKVENAEVWKAYREMYNSENFIHLVKYKKGLYQLPDPKVVIGTNYVDIGFELDEHVPRLVVFSAIDNIVKGAAGQAVQSWNASNSWDEKTGLDLIGLH